MQGDNGLSALTPVAPSRVDGAVSKPDIARQLLIADRASEGGLIAQLTSNPFFTAVSYEYSPMLLY
jgi:hypothetical protein